MKQGISQKDPRDAVRRAALVQTQADDDWVSEWKETRR